MMLSTVSLSQWHASCGAAACARHACPPWAPKAHPGFNATPRSAHMKNKFCPQCRIGFTISADRVFCLRPEDVDRYDNTSCSGVWKTRVFDTTARYRLINQTMHCRGPRLVVLEGPMPIDHAFDVLPAAWVRHVHAHSVCACALHVAHCVCMYHCLCRCGRADSCDCARRMAPWCLSRLWGRRTPASAGTRTHGCNHALRLQPHAPKLQPHVPKLQLSTL